MDLILAMPKGSSLREIVCRKAVFCILLTILFIHRWKEFAVQRSVLTFTDMYMF